MQSAEVQAISRAPGPDSLQLRTTDVPPPGPGEARVRVEAAGVSYGDLLFQRGVVPFGPKPPFVPGCDLTGVVEAVGAGVTALRPGDRVTALVKSGGYCTVRNLPADRLVPVPAGVPATKVAAVTLNYFIAYQMLHRVAKVQPGQRIVVHGAAGGVGLAFLQLAEPIQDLTIWGTASAHNADLVGRYGAIPIDYHTQDFVAVVEAAGDAVDAVFDPIGGTHFRRSYRLLKPGGRLVAYGQNDALRNGRNNRRVGGIGFLGGIVLPKLIPDGRRTGFYSAWSLEKSQPAAYREDLGTVLSLLAAGSIAPASLTVLPLAAAGKAFQTLEDGTSGKIVLDCTA